MTKSTSEYYVIQPVRLEGEHVKAFELVKYNHRSQVTGRGNVFLHKDGAFTSNDSGFKTHKNELASRRIRIVKKHIENGEPNVACYSLVNGEVQCFKL